MKKVKEPKIYKSYPEILPVFVALFIVGLIISERFTPDLYITWLGISFAALLLSFFLQSQKTKGIALIIAALTSSMFYGSVRHTEKWDFSDLLVLDNSIGTVYGRYTGQSSIHHKNKINYVFKEVSYTTNEQTVDIPIDINCSYILDRQRLYPEQYYSMTGKMKIVSFDKPPVFEVESFAPAEQKLPSVSSTAKEVQQRIRLGLNKSLGDEHASIVTGFILGDTSKIVDKSIFVETGISHILAISGQHIMILILVIASIMHWFKIPPISRSILISVILAFYAMVTVGSPSVWRALIMYIAVAVIMQIEAASSPVRPVAIAAFLMLLYEPAYLKHAGFILSFTAVLSIIFIRQPFEYVLNKIHFPKMLSRYLAVSFAANLGTMPMVAYLFGTLSLSSLFVNPLVLWTFTFILPISFLIAFLSVFSISTVYLSSGLSVLLDTLIRFLENVKSIPGLYFYVGNISPVTILIIYALMLYLTAIFNKWQIRRLEESYNKSQIDKIPVTELPKEKSIEIRIDSKSKATPTLTGKKLYVPKEEKVVRKKRFINPFINLEIVSAIDEVLSSLKRLKVSSNDSQKELIPVKNLVIDSQNLYYRLYDMNEDLFEKEPERLLQAHIFMLSIAGYELLNRLSPNLVNLETVAQSEYENDYNVESEVKDKFLSVALRSDTIMSKIVIENVTDNQLKVILNQGKVLFLRAQKLLDKILKDENFNDSVEQHLFLRDEFVKWCWSFVQYDNILKLQRKKNLR